mgnify:CR=1 FL=1
MTETQIMALAKAKGQTAVLVEFAGTWHWLLTDSPITSIDDLMGSLKTDDWLDYEKGKWKVYDKNGTVLSQTKEYRWKELEPIFVRKGAFKKSFFFHYNKPKSRELKKVQISLHYNKTCYTVDNIVCNVPTKGRIQKTQPYWVMAGKAKNITIEKRIAYII